MALMNYFVVCVDMARLRAWRHEPLEACNHLLMILCFGKESLSPLCVGVLGDQRIFLHFEKRCCPIAPCGLLSTYFQTEVPQVVRQVHERR